MVAAALAVRSYMGQRDAAWQARVESEMVRAEAALAIGDQLREEATTLEGVVDSLYVEAQRQDTVIQQMIVELPAPPVDCEPFTLPRDAVILELGEQNDTISEALRQQREAAGLLRAAESRARAAADSLLAVLDDRPRPLSPFIPSVGLGCTAGISALTRQPDVACGLTLSWEVKLF